MKLNFKQVQTFLQLVQTCVFLALVHGAKNPIYNRVLHQHFAPTQK